MLRAASCEEVTVFLVEHPMNLFTTDLSAVDGTHPAMVHDA
ncbi:hypothetical protein ABKN59_003214 [Abortiporus biennis]